MLLSLLIAACESVEPAGGVFTPVEGASTAPVPVPAAGVVPVADEPTVATPPAVPASVVPVAPAVGLPVGARWPIRLVSTLPEAQPPRAVLGLPSGEEVVVAPGSMIPAEGLVVVAVSEGQVELARVEAAGDHANISTVILEAQYR